MSKLKACVRCGYLVEEDTEICPACHGDDFTENWRGVAVILDTKSQTADRLNAKIPGKYALRVEE
ncbi:transcription elongation factor subunit Spt4 [Methanopyrus sp.]